MTEAASDPTSRLIHRHRHGVNHVRRGEGIASERSDQRAWPRGDDGLAHQRTGSWCAGRTSASGERARRSSANHGGGEVHPTAPATAEHALASTTGLAESGAEWPSGRTTAVMGSAGRLPATRSGPVGELSPTRPARAGRVPTPGCLAPTGVPAAAPCPAEAQQVAREPAMVGGRRRGGPGRRRGGCRRRRSKRRCGRHREPGAIDHRSAGSCGPGDDGSLRTGDPRGTRRSCAGSSAVRADSGGRRPARVAAVC